MKEGRAENVRRQGDSERTGTDSHGVNQDDLLRSYVALAGENVQVYKLLIVSIEKLTQVLESRIPSTPPAPLVKKHRRLTSEIERNEREQKACLALKQLGPNKTAIAEFVGCSRGTLDAMPNFVELFNLMSQAPDRDKSTDQTSQDGSKRKRFRGDRHND